MMSPFLIPPTKLWMNLFFFQLGKPSVSKWQVLFLNHWTNREMRVLIWRSVTRLLKWFTTFWERDTPDEFMKMIVFVIARDLLEAMARAQHIQNIWELITSEESLETVDVLLLYTRTKSQSHFLISQSSDSWTRQRFLFPNWSHVCSCVQLFSVVRGLWEDYQRGAASGKRPEGYKATVGVAT